MEVCDFRASGLAVGFVYCKMSKSQGDAVPSLRRSATMQSNARCDVNEQSRLEVVFLVLLRRAPLGCYACVFRTASVGKQSMAETSGWHGFRHCVRPRDLCRSLPFEMFKHVPFSKSQARQ